MIELPNEIFLNIMTYIYYNTCRYNMNIFPINKMIYKYFNSKCEVISYYPLNYNKKYCRLRPIISCSYHGSEYINETIKTLNSLKSYNRQNMNKTSVHFSSEEICKSALKYVKEYGIISHLCCSNKGVVFIGEDEMVNTFI